MASHVTKLFLGIVEPDITIFLKAGEEMGEMNVVKLGTGSDAESVFLDDGSTSGSIPYGWCTQNVTTAGVAQYGLNGLYTRTTKVGEVVGIYVGGGVLKTNKLASAVNAGDKLYVGASGGAAGYVRNTGSTQDYVVGLAETDVDADGIVRFKSLI
jgi:hypothetical protein